VSGETDLASREVELYTLNSKHQWVHEVGHGNTSVTGVTTSYRMHYLGTSTYAAA
jgi:hypothetical protein